MKTFLLSLLVRAVWMFTYLACVAICIGIGTVFIYLVAYCTLTRSCE